MSARILISAVFVFFMAACESQNRSPVASENRDSSAPTTFTGTLHSGVLGIGGEHTGWILAGDGEAGGIEVDVSQLRDAARQNDGKRVTISGKMIDRNYTERGKVPVLMAESIQPAPKPQANQPAVKGVG